MKKTTGITNLQALIKHMNPVLNEGAYVFVSVKNIETIPRNITIGEFKEKEGTTVILSKENAEKLGLTYDFIAAWITLEVHSALEAVGLTAAFSNELAQHHISCNVMAGYFHDHIFVAQKDGQKAMNILNNMKN